VNYLANSRRIFRGVFFIFRRVSQSAFDLLASSF
jgi:hypothetical protein